ncbi:MAG: GNAT family N-acetyltransferase [Gammaproteobacteria bacterium]
MRVTRAKPEDAVELSEIAHAAKAHWGYSDAQLKSWATELTYTAEYINSHWVAVVKDDDTPFDTLGVCSLDVVGDQLEIAGMWVRPEAMGRGVGRVLLNAAVAHCKEQSVSILRLLADPNAEGFYASMGAVLIGQERGSPTGRLLPLMHINIE